tara:strand:- start:55 stop:1797 length:1743 start_codon:yes stop_codon:yes gene_type:complete
METIAQTFSGSTKITATEPTSTATISRNGDLIHKMYLVCNDPIKSGDKPINGTNIIKTAELEIGGQKIDKHWSTWNNIWNELSTPESKAIGLKSMQGDIGNAKSAQAIEDGTTVKSIQIPLNFWFCRNPGLALPLIALQYHEVKVTFVFNSYNTINVHNNTNVEFYVDYIYLDTDERRRFAQVSHEYLIEQIQKQDITGSTSQKLIFNHPVKELIWTGDNYTEAQLKLNGHDRFSTQRPEYFQLRQPFDYHTAIPSQNLPIGARISGGAMRGAEDLVPLADAAFSGSSDTFTGHLTGKDLEGRILISGDGKIINIGTSGAPTNSQLAEFKVGDTIALIGSVDASVTSNKEDAIGFVGTGDGNNGEPAAIQDVLNDIRLGIEFDGVEETGHGLSATNDGAGQTAVIAQTVTDVIAAVGTQAVSSLANVFTGIIAETPIPEDNSIKLTLTAGLNNGTNFISSLNAGDPATAEELVEANNDTPFTDTSADIKFDVNAAQFKLRKVDNRVVSEARTSQMTQKINVYSFALKPEEHQPSGTCNFSRIDTAILDLTGNATAEGEIYAVNYNVLRIMSGMGGLAYSN